MEGLSLDALVVLIRLRKLIAARKWGLAWEALAKLELLAGPLR